MSTTHFDSVRFLGEPALAPADVRECICGICTCGKHTCPLHGVQVETFKFTGTSTYTSDFPLKKCSAVVRAPARRSSAAPLPSEGSAFEGQTSYEIDYAAPKLEGALQSQPRRASRTAASVSTSRPPPFDGSTTTADAYRAWAIPLREPCIPGGGKAPASTEPPPHFEGSSESASSYVPWALQAREPFVSPTQAHSTAAFEGSSTYAEQFPQWGPAVTAAATRRATKHAAPLHTTGAPFEGTATTAFDFRPRPAAALLRAARNQGATSEAHPAFAFEGSSTYRTEFTPKAASAAPPPRRAPPQSQWAAGAGGGPSFAGQSSYDADYAAPPQGAMASKTKSSALRTSYAPSFAPFDGSATTADAYRAWAIPLREPCIPGGGKAPASTELPPHFKGSSESASSYVPWALQARDPFVPPTQPHVALPFEGASTYGASFPAWAQRPPPGGPTAGRRGVSPPGSAWQVGADTRDWATEQRRQYVAQPMEPRCPASFLNHPPPLAAPRAAADRSGGAPASGGATPASVPTSSASGL